MHIAFLTPEYSRDRAPEGGLGNYLRKVSLELCRLGHRVSVLCLGKSNAQWQDQGIEVCEVKRFQFSYRLRGVKRLDFCLPAIAHLRSARRLEKALWEVHRRAPVDIVQASNYKVPGYTLRHNAQMPLVCRLSSYTPLLRSACGRTRSVGDSVSDWLEARQVLDADAAFAPSEFLAGIFSRLEGYQPRIIRTPANLEEIAFDHSFHESHLKGDAYLLYFGDLNEIKGVDLLAPVAAEVLRRHPNLKFVFIGRDLGLLGGQKVFDLLCRANEPFRERLFYHPPLPKTQLYPVIANAIGVLMPSRVDNLPNACLEAQALGIPVVGTYDSSLDELITEGETGFLARNGDWKSLCAATERLLAQTESARAEMRGRIAENVAKAKSEDRVGQLVEFYHATIANWRRR